ncbi:MAG: hypothetical protein COS39_10510 [Hydrogenophilales bacterium CG03_land_8_20_14_0_80_62_28]|nr:MAG: hypothetical protein AUJ86_03070 [Hydrogenophilaceae bacterium CG1_02_62_390]PIV21614.1 MAG: hypothetical protein COS39_10510 [Hydrogenophilales bacterium CG03_land_8_20_14_0_80_62_28]PIW37697.1 MAG: hypothetical protein COW23_10345 [Hydrogenophilales bacterium CG15_BIG_FIL_POST_REV_8_21_14_020_62_31]PIW71398.1 MAG: hypothetical protein COW07_08450 [Hydrogenophilales bacterium CG12_big_fil_rev_8_21_14_0_65_61_21]PIX01714.1 MAG: hypothetical protein COZ79_05530 [Hydrogenophilales bacteri
MPSLRQKILLGYVALAILLLGLSIRVLVELRDMEIQIKTGARISEFFDSALEMRRFEKNYFLYRQAADLNEYHRFLAQGGKLLDENPEVFIGLASPQRVQALRERLNRYAAEMGKYAMLADPGIAQAIRALGMEIVSTAQTLEEAERRSIRQRIEQHRREFLFTLSGLLILLTVSALLVLRNIVRPLQDMEIRMEAIAQGSTDRLAATSHDREIASLVRAANHMLDELRLRQRQQLLQTERLASLGRLISGVAHEINNPLSNISSSAQILLEDETTDPAWQRELLQQIDSETTRAQNIVRSLLDYARKRQSEQTAISLRPMVQETLRFLRADIPENVNIELDIPETLVVQGDKSHLQQAWFNLLRNAVESIENIGEVRVLAFALASGEAVIKIWDNGHGIATEVLPHVFEPFYSTRQDGAGMGLFIVKEIIDEHGGAISVESEPGKGTQFTVELPTGASQPENS